MKLLAISPHPDDVEFGCGGTLAKFAKSGWKIHLLYMTCGELGGNPKLRKKEAEHAASLLKARIFWGGFSDTQIPLAKETNDRIETVIDEVSPNLILTPYHDDTHQDHRNTARATVTATRYARNVLAYEVPTSVHFNPTVFVDIGSMLKSKMALLRAHKSQVYQTKVPDLSILENARSTAVFRGIQYRVKYAEGFLPIRLGLDFQCS
ncbi:MAG: PIG-L deacetylase family protein [Elusimicrobiota bacterium]